MSESNTEVAEAAETPSANQNPVPVQPLPTTKAPMPSDVVAQPVAPKQQRLVMMIIIAIVAVLTIGSLITFAILSNSPEARLSKALTNLRDAESVALEISADVDDGSGTTLSIGAESSVIYSPLQVQLGAELDVLITKLGIDVMYLDGDYYLRLGGLTGLEDLIPLLLAQQGLSSSISEEDQKQLDALTSILATVISEYDEEWVVIQGSVAKEAGLDMEALVSQLQQNYANIDNLADALTINQVFEDEMIDGKTTTHMELALNPAEAQTALTTLFSGLTIGDETLTREEVQMELEDIFDNYNPATDVVQAWIDTDTNQLVQLQLNFDESEDVQQITAKMSNYNSVEVISAPEDPKTLLEVTATFTDIMNQLGELNPQAADFIDLPL